MPSMIKIVILTTLLRVHARIFVHKELASYIRKSVFPLSIDWFNDFDLISLRTIPSSRDNKNRSHSINYPRAFPFNALFKQSNGMRDASVKWVNITVGRECSRSIWLQQGETIIVFICVNSANQIAKYVNEKRTDTSPIKGEIKQLNQ